MLVHASLSFLFFFFLLSVLRKGKQRQKYTDGTTSTKIKKIINKMKRQPTKWEKMSANNMYNKGLISKLSKEVIVSQFSPSVMSDSL